MSRREIQYPKHLPLKFDLDKNIEQELNFTFAYLIEKSKNVKQDADQKIRKIMAKI